jgi:hypothetical protein
MPNIDIPIPVDLNKTFQFPPCDQVKLPFPSPLKINLPTGGTLTAFSDLSKGIPTDCSQTFNLLVQIAPFLASTECLLKVLGLIGPLIEVMRALNPPNPLKLGSAIPKFINATIPVMECVAVVTGFGVIPFLRDLLCLIIKALKCFTSQMQSVLGVMKGLALQLDAATQAGDTDLLNAIQCEQNNAAAMAANMTASIEPIGVILQLAGTFFGIVGKEPITLPSLGSQTDIDSLNTLLQTIQGVIGTLQIVADGLGGCS